MNGKNSPVRCHQIVGEYENKKIDIIERMWKNMSFHFYLLGSLKFPFVPHRPDVFI